MYAKLTQFNVSSRLVLSALILNIDAFSSSIFPFGEYYLVAPLI